MRIDNRSEMVRSRFTMDTSDFDKFGGALSCFLFLLLLSSNWLLRWDSFTDPCGDHIQVKTSSGRIDWEPVVIRTFFYLAD